MKLSFNFKKTKIGKKIFSVRYFYVLIAIMAIISFIILGQFLYKNFYLTITQAQDIVILRQEVAPDSINVERVNKVLDLIDKKIEAEKPQNLELAKNPFGLFSSPQAGVPGID